MLKSLQALEPGTARAQEWPQSRSLKLWRGAFCELFSCRCRICRRSDPAGAPEALLEGVPGSGR
eukprot:9360483-Alexandrium_andersonii.AAC.1